MKYYPNYDDTTKEPGKDEKLADAKVEASYEGYDEYNDPDFGSDSYMKGKAYPEIVSIRLNWKIMKSGYRYMFRLWKESQQEAELRTKTSS